MNKAIALIAGLLAVTAGVFAVIEGGDVTRSTLLTEPDDISGLTNSVTWTDLRQYAEDPQMMMSAIATNAEAIDNLNPPREIHIVSTGDPVADGIALVDAVTAGNGTGTENVYIVSDGEYTLPSTLLIDDQIATVRAKWSQPCAWIGNVNYAYQEQIGSFIPSEPVNIPTVTLTGSVQINANSLGSMIKGFTVTGGIQAPQNAYTDIMVKPPTRIVNCWVHGSSFASDSSVLLQGSFFSDTVSPMGAVWAGHAQNSLFLANGSFYEVTTGWGKGGVGAGFEDCWIDSSAAFGLKGTSSVWFFEGCYVNGDGNFFSDGGQGYVRADRTYFYGLASGAWLGINVGSPTVFIRTDGVERDIADALVTPAKYCTDEQGALIP